MKFYSPLRYPGGKNKLAKFISLVCVKNNIDGHYIEPYAGGASVALHLLINGYVKEITINDRDKAIYAFWYSVRNNSEKLCKKIKNTDITIKNWEKQKKIQRNKDKEKNLLKLGFSTLFLNRTNYSGIIDGGMIGGPKQKSDYKIDCRFNKEELIKRIQLIAKYKKNIHLQNLDAMKLIEKISEKNESNNVIFYFDPPYFLKGQSLYMNSYDASNHKEVSEGIKKIKNARWIVSYDDVTQINLLYADKNIKKIHYFLNHSAYKQKRGKEVLFCSANLNHIPIGDPTKVVL